MTKIIYRETEHVSTLYNVYLVKNYLSRAAAQRSKSHLPNNNFKQQL